MSHYIALVAGRNAGQQIQNRQEGKRGLHRELGRWDWFQPGGRFAGALVLKPRAKALELQRRSRWQNPGTIAALAKDIDVTATLERLELCRALVRDSRWTDLGVMGWWGIDRVDLRQASRAKRIRAWLQALPANMPVTVLDCHI